MPKWPSATVVAEEAEKWRIIKIIKSNKKDEVGCVAGQEDTEKYRHIVAFLCVYINNLNKHNNFHHISQQINNRRKAGRWELSEKMIRVRRREKWNALRISDLVLCDLLFVYISCYLRPNPNTLIIKQVIIINSWNAKRRSRRQDEKIASKKSYLLLQLISNKMDCKVQLRFEKVIQQHVLLVPYLMSVLTVFFGFYFPSITTIRDVKSEKPQKRICSIKFIKYVFSRATSILAQLTICHGLCK